MLSSTASSRSAEALKIASVPSTISETTKKIGARLRTLTTRPCLRMTAGFQSPYSKYWRKSLRKLPRGV